MKRFLFLCTLGFTSLSASVPSLLDEGMAKTSSWTISEEDQQICASLSVKDMLEKNEDFFQDAPVAHTLRRILQFLQGKDVCDKGLRRFRTEFVLNGNLQNNFLPLLRAFYLYPLQKSPSDGGPFPKALESYLEEIASDSLYQASRLDANLHETSLTIFKNGLCLTENAYPFAHIPVCLQQMHNLTSLQVLNLTLCSLYNLAQVSSLKTLDLTNISQFYGSGTFQSLESLVLSSCTQHPLSAKAFPHLKELRLYQSDPIAPELLRTLTTLTLFQVAKSTGEVNLSLDLFSLPLLKTLSLIDNKITTLPSFTSSMGPCLKTLSLWQNALTSLNWVRFLPHLQELDVSSNRIRDLPAELAQHPALERVDLSGNTLKFFDRTFFPAPRETLKITIDGKQYKTLHAFYKPTDIINFVPKKDPASGLLLGNELLPFLITSGF